MTTKVEKEYDVALDEKKRTTLRGADFNHYHVKRFVDGSYLFQPRVLIEPDVLKQIDASIKNFKKGKKGKKLDLEKTPDV